MLWKAAILSVILGFCFVLDAEARPSKSKGQKRARKKSDDAIKEPKLTKEEWRQIHKFEDALKDEEGKLFYTDSWAVQMTDPAEVEVADRIAAKHGFVNLGKVCNLYECTYESCVERSCAARNARTWSQLSRRSIILVDACQAFELGYKC